jgi:hypothetical protein
MSFADLASRFEAVAAYVIRGEKTLVDFMNMIKMRIECEEASIVGLKKIGNANWSESEQSSLFEGRLAYIVSMQMQSSKLVSFHWYCFGFSFCVLCLSGIDAFRCDALNQAKVKGDLVESLRIDVLDSVAEMHRTYTKVSSKLLQQGLFVRV